MCLCFFSQVMLIGDSGVGKTCLLVRFKDGAFLSGSFISTVGIDFRVSASNPMGATQILVFYTYRTRETRKGLFFFFFTERNSGESQLGVKLCLFSRERVLFEFYEGAFKGHFSNFLYSIKCVQKQILFMGAKLQNSCLGVFFLKRTNLY